MLYFFKDSSVRRDEFHSLKELVEPNSQYIALVQYHRVWWLSFSDYVSRLVKLLPLLFRYFEEQALLTLVTGKRSERNADPFIANCLNQDSNSSFFSGTSIRSSC